MRFIALLPALLVALVMAWLTGMWQFALFAFLSVVSGLITSTLIRHKRKEPDMDFSDQPIWISPQAVAIGDKVLPRTGFFFKEQYSDIFFDYFSNLAAERDIKQRASLLEESFYKAAISGALPFWAGVSDGADLEFDLARDGPHSLIVGSTGSGKSEFLKLITGSLLVGLPKELLRLVMIDFKGGAALSQLASHPSSLTLVTDIDGGNHERFWLYLQGELKARELLLARNNLSSIDQMPQLPRMIVLADELPAILASHPLATITFEAIAARGRSLGVHLIATSQSLSGIPRALLTNLTLRFALGVTDPGDLIALIPTIRPGNLGPARAVAVSGAKAVSFDYPMVKALPDLGGLKVSPEETAAWSLGLPTNIPAVGKVIGFIDEPLQHSVTELSFADFAGNSVLVVGASKSGKSLFCQRVEQLATGAVVLDCPSLEQIEHSLIQNVQVVCAVASSFVLPLSMQRKFEHVIYLRQSNLDQHLAAGLPKSQWSETLNAGRCWYRNKMMQLVMPTQTQLSHVQVSEPQLPVH